MSTGDARRSQSAISFSFTKKQSENTTSQRATKRLGENLEEATPTIIVNQASTVTITEESVNINHKLLTASPNHYTQPNCRLALKLNRLKEKSARYVSHKDFIKQCIKSKLVPKGLELTLEPTIRNYDQDFIDNWYSNLKDFSLVSMEQIVSFCDKKIEETAVKINNTESILKQQLEKKNTKK